LQLIPAGLKQTRGNIDGQRYQNALMHIVGTTTKGLDIRQVQEVVLMPVADIKKQGRFHTKPDTQSI